MAEEFKDPMEYIWDRVPKNKQGLIHYLPGDIPYLYDNGFVDTTRYTLDQWKAAFEECKQKDDSYLVSKDKFMSLRKYRYAGPVWKPFEPEKLRDGEWPDEELELLYEKSIKIATGLTKDFYWQTIKALKSQGYTTKNGNLNIGKEVKSHFTYLVERNPSPRRKLELEVKRIQEEREAQHQATTANRNLSSFSTGKMTSEAKLDKLKELQTSTSSKKAAKAPALKTQEAIDIKKLKRPPPKISG